MSCMRRYIQRALLVVVMAAAAVLPVYAYASGYKVVPLPCTTGCARQQTTYWCGPASTHIVLHRRGRNVSQSALARQLGTTTGGTAIGKIASVLTSYTTPFRYVAVPRTNLTTYALLRNIVMYSVDRASLAVPCVNPYPYKNTAGYSSPGLPTYSGTRAGGHYIVLRGYYFSSSVDRIYYFDPHWDSTHYGARYTTTPTMYKCIYVKNYGSQGIVY